MRNPRRDIFCYDITEWDCSRCKFPSPIVFQPITTRIMCFSRIERYDRLCSRSHIRSPRERTFEAPTEKTRNFLRNPFHVILKTIGGYSVPRFCFCGYPPIFQTRKRNKENSHGRESARGVPGAEDLEGVRAALPQGRDQEGDGDLRDHPARGMVRLQAHHSSSREVIRLGTSLERGATRASLS